MSSILMVWYVEVKSRNECGAKAFKRFAIPGDTS